MTNNDDDLFNELYGDEEERREEQERQKPSKEDVIETNKNVEEAEAKMFEEIENATAPAALQEVQTEQVFQNNEKDEEMNEDEDNEEDIEDSDSDEEGVNIVYKPDSRQQSLKGMNQASNANSQELQQKQQIAKSGTDKTSSTSQEDALTHISIGMRKISSSDQNQSSHGTNKIGKEANFFTGANYTPMFAEFPKGPKMNSQVFETELDQLEDKPWRKSGTDISDYFNYGFTEETWNLYCQKQKQLRIEQNMQNQIRVYNGPQNGTNKNITSNSSSIPLLPDVRDSMYSGMKPNENVQASPRSSEFIPPSHHTTQVTTDGEERRHGRSDSRSRRSHSHDNYHGSDHHHHHHHSYSSSSSHTKHIDKSPSPSVKSSPKPPSVSGSKKEKRSTSRTRESPSSSGRKRDREERDHRERETRESRERRNSKERRGHSHSSSSSRKGSHSSADHHNRSSSRRDNRPGSSSSGTSGRSKDEREAKRRR